VDRVLVDAAPAARVLDPAALGDEEVGALAEHPGAELVRVDADLLVGPVADVVVPLGGGLDVGADAAGVEQVDGGGQDRLDQLGRRELLASTRSSSRTWS
jgi:hypothetical protein